MYFGEFWIFVKNFFEGHTSPPPRSAFAPPVPLHNEPGCLVYLRNLLGVNLLQYWYTCLSVAMSVEISVFGWYFWWGGFVYILRKWIFYFTPFSILFYHILSQFVTHLFYRFSSFFHPFVFRLFYRFFVFSCSFLSLFFYCWFVVNVPR